MYGLIALIWTRKDLKTTFQMYMNIAWNEE